MSTELEPSAPAHRVPDRELEGFLSLPKSRNPTGWFQVAWSDEIAPGAVKLVHYFGQNIVIWRGESGTLYALDAYCLHLGGNLGVKGEVHGDEIECPWHGWRWNGAGRNTLIPYSERQPRKPRLQMKVWRIRDWNSCVIVWHDLAGREPLWEPPDFAELHTGEYYPIGESMRTSYKIKSHPQLIIENGADFAHIKKVHGAGVWPTIKRFEFNDYEWLAEVATEYGAGKKSTSLTPDGAVELTLKFHTWGLGIGASFWPPELIAAIMLVNVTPVDETYSVQWYCMTTVRQSDDEGDEPTGMARTMIDHQRRTVEQDHFTWENMKVLHPPNFAPEEADNYAAMRRWARRFYPDLEDGN
jgi:phenylpropionate dioxygenase-like ring-hydroxylating dioxygenase large terminal subunit